MAPHILDELPDMLGLFQHQLEEDAKAMKAKVQGLDTRRRNLNTRVHARLDNHGAAMGRAEKYMEKMEAVEAKMSNRPPEEESLPPPSAPPSVSAPAVPQEMPSAADSGSDVGSVAPQTNGAAAPAQHVASIEERGGHASSIV